MSRSLGRGRGLRRKSEATPTPGKLDNSKDTPKSSVAIFSIDSQPPITPEKTNTLPQNVIRQYSAPPLTPTIITKSQLKASPKPQVCYKKSIDLGPNSIMLESDDGQLMKKACNLLRAHLSASPILTNSEGNTFNSLDISHKGFSDSTLSRTSIDESAHPGAQLQFKNAFTDTSDLSQYSPTDLDYPRHVCCKCRLAIDDIIKQHEARKVGSSDIYGGNVSQLESAQHNETNTSEQAEKNTSDEFLPKEILLQNENAQHSERNADRKDLSQAQIMGNNASVIEIPTASEVAIEEQRMDMSGNNSASARNTVDDETCANKAAQYEDVSDDKLEQDGIVPQDDAKTISDGDRRILTASHGVKVHVIREPLFPASPANIVETVKATLPNGPSGVCARRFMFKATAEQRAKALRLAEEIKDLDSGDIDESSEGEDEMGHDEMCENKKSVGYADSSLAEGASNEFMAYDIDVLDLESNNTPPCTSGNNSTIRSDEAPSEMHAISGDQPTNTAPLVRYDRDTLLQYSDNIYTPSDWDYMIQNFPQICYTPEESDRKHRPRYETPHIPWSNSSYSKGSVFSRERINDELQRVEDFQQGRYTRNYNAFY